MDCGQEDGERREKNNFRRAVPAYCLRESIGRRHHHDNRDTEGDSIESLTYSSWSCNRIDSWAFNLDLIRSQSSKYSFSSDMDMDCCRNIEITIKNLPTHSPKFLMERIDEHSSFNGYNECTVFETVRFFSQTHFLHVSFFGQWMPWNLLCSETIISKWPPMDNLPSNYLKR